MGGIGSGRGLRWDKKATLEATKRLDIRILRKHGYLRSGCTGTLSWSRRGVHVGEVGFRTFDDRLVLSYNYREQGGEWESVDETIWFTETECNYGKSRKWFQCPGCSKRVGILSGFGKLFLCRHCYRLPNATSNESKFDRLITAREKLKHRLYDEACYRKKRGMHSKTFNRLRERYWHLEGVIDDFIEKRLDVLHKF